MAVENIAIMMLGAYAIVYIFIYKKIKYFGSILMLGLGAVAMYQAYKSTTYTGTWADEIIAFILIMVAIVCLIMDWIND